MLISQQCKPPKLDRGNRWKEPASRNSSTSPRRPANHFTVDAMTAFCRSVLASNELCSIVIQSKRDWPVSLRESVRDRINPLSRLRIAKPHRARATVSPSLDPRRSCGRAASGNALSSVPIQCHEIKKEGDETRSRLCHSSASRASDEMDSRRNSMLASGSSKIAVNLI